MNKKDYYEPRSFKGYLMTVLATIKSGFTRLFLVALILASAIIPLLPQQTAKADTLGSLANGGTWIKTGSPVFTVGAAGTWDSYWVQFNSIVTVGNTLYAYYHGENITTLSRRIGLATSVDGGLTWARHASNPVLSVGAGGAWDNFAVGYPTVWIEGATWYMMYMGQNSTAAGKMQIGLATSLDGVTWTKSGSNPVIPNGAGSAWDSSLLQPGTTMIKESGTYYFYYWGNNVTALSNNSGIGLATSTNLTTWIKEATNPVLHSSTNIYDWDYSVLSPTVMNINGTYSMWYEGAPYDSGNFGDSQTGFATSTDKINWTKSPSNPVVPNSAGTSAWDKSWTEVAVIAQVGTSYRLFYGGGARITPPCQEGLAILSETDFLYRQKGTILGAASNVTNYAEEVYIHKGIGTSSGKNVYLNNLASSWTGSVPNDLRFTTSDGLTQLPYWIESSNTTDATVWVKLGTIAASPTTTNYYAYYGATGVNTTSNANIVFPFFDDFNTNDLTKWTAVGNVTISGGNMLVRAINPDVTSSSASKLAFSTNYSMRTRLKTDHAGSNALIEDVQFTVVADGKGYRAYYSTTNPAQVNKYMSFNGTVFLNDIVGWSANTYHVQEMARSSSDNVTFTVDDSNTVISSSGITTTDKVAYFQVSDAAFAAVDTVDWVLFRPFISSEPSWAAWDASLPSVTTGTPTNVGSTATLNGNISSMGVASSTYAYFTWSQSGITHNTPLQTKSAMGAYSATITYDPNKPLNVIAITQVGSVTSTGSWVTLSPIQGNSVFKTLIPILFGIVVAFVILSIAFSAGITIQILAIAAVGGTLAYYVVVAIINLLF